MAHDDQTYGGYENGLDWITDMAIEDYKFNKQKGADDGKKSKSNDPGRSPGRSNL